MANIQFIPVCSKCGGTIFDQICYEEIPEHLATSGCIYKQYQIYPEYCKACGEPFEQIIMQKIIAINHNSGRNDF
jgi:hypothetical protein